MPSNDDASTEIVTGEEVKAAPFLHPLLCSPKFGIKKLGNYV